MIPKNILTLPNLKLNIHLYVMMFTFSKNKIKVYFNLWKLYYDKHCNVSLDHNSFETSDNNKCI